VPSTHGRRRATSGRRLRSCPSWAVSAGCSPYSVNPVFLLSVKSDNALFDNRPSPPAPQEAAGEEDIRTGVPPPPKAEHKADPERSRGVGRVRSAAFNPCDACAATVPLPATKEVHQHKP
jgi:hypothetical protein